MISQIYNEIVNNQKIIILRHRNPDPDAVGSQIALKLILQKAFPNKDIFATGVDLPIFDWIGKMDQLEQSDYQDAIIIAVDTANTERIDDEHDLSVAKKILKIDHHPDVDHFGELNWVKDHYSSCAELIFKFADKMDLQITPKIADCLYAGIIGDTNRFLYADTNFRTLDTAAKLVKLGADASKISHEENEINLQTARLEAYMLENFSLNDSGFAYIILNKQLLDIFNLNPGELDYAVPLIGKIDSVKTWAVLSENETNIFRVNLRSKNIPINSVAEKFGGGGHALASGVYVHGDESVNLLIKEMDNITNEAEKN
ncbi:DHH family phosphoesterase [Companilactobacillus zhongbaensis]|uniref:DHH family phosphoesterase n=1 Tax=Companilactobacillus zhongbaensis TaxID=2486009 RepID=UPI000F7A1072|nr:bifunctional oligoribonuclease/PAP phosphatase NrnA [Companilactobacillus zhongbaensis]